jgi:hypothetical protein
MPKGIGVKGGKKRLTTQRIQDREVTTVKIK